MAIKPIVGTVVLWWIYRREWKALGGVAASALTRRGLSAAIFGLPNLAAWSWELGAVSWPWVAMNASVWGPWTRVFSPSPYFIPLATAPVVRAVGIALSVALISALTIRSLRRTEDRDRGWALCLSWALLVSPLGAIYYAWWPLAPMSQLRLSPRVWIAVAAAWLWTPFAIVNFSQTAPG